MPEVRIGIVGTRRGGSHNRVFAGHPECEIVAVCDVRAVRALRAGKHLLSEIPLATDLDHCREIVALSDTGNLKVQMGNECRWMPYLQAVRAMAEAGDFGAFFYGEAEYLHNLRME